MEKRLRVGWISADYKDHPVVKDLVHMFSMFGQNASSPDSGLSLPPRRVFLILFSNVRPLPDLCVFLP